MPADSAVDADVASDVELHFSERMNTESVERSLFITPYPDPYPALRWSRGDRTLALRFDSDMLDDRTYVVTVGTDATDAHSVSMASAATIAFATGPEIDVGEIAGTVWRGEKSRLAPASAATVGLYPLPSEEPQQATKVDPVLGYAAYQTQSDAEGRFAFRYLAPGLYGVVAWIDSEKDDVPGADESVAVPARHVDLAEAERATIPHMRLSTYERVAPELFMIRAIDEYRLEIRFGEAVRSDSVSLAIVGPDSIDIEAVPAPEASTTIVAQTSGLQQGVAYAVEMRAVDMSGNVALWGADTTYVDGAATSDTSGPAVVHVSVPAPLVSDSPPRLTFWLDELLGDVATDSFHVWEDSTSVAGHWQPSGANTLRFMPDDGLADGRHVWRVAMTGASDRHGNRSADTADVALNRVPPDSLGALVGHVVDTDTARVDSIVVSAHPLTGDWAVRTTIAEPGEWRIAALPAGSYRIVAWRDTDGDGEWSPGRLAPFLPPEPWAISDTVRARARWTVSGTQLTLE